MRPIWIRPSSANLWARPTGCLASCTFEPAAKGSAETEHTLRGTRLHEAVASIIAPNDHKRPRLEAGEWKVAQQAVAELEMHVQVDAYAWRVETKVGRHMGLDNRQAVWMDGTPDLVGIARQGGWRGRGTHAPEPRMVIADFKFGRMLVEAEKNHQLAAYAVLLLFGEDKWAHSIGQQWKDADTIRTMIIQPAAGDAGGSVVKKDLLNYEQVRKGAGYFDYIVDRASDPDYELTYNPTPDNCRYCRGAETGQCPEVAKSLPAAEAEVRLTASKEMWPYHYADFLARADLVAEMARHVREDAQRRLERGEPVQGLKLVPGRQGNRRWKDAAATAKELLELGDHGNRVELFSEPALLSPAQLQKRFKGITAPVSEGIIARGTERPPATKTVAYEDDPRPALGQTAVAKAIAHFKANMEKING